MEITSTLDVISINKLRLNLTFNDLNLAAWPLSSLSRTYFKAKFQLCSQLPQDSNLEWTKSSHATFGGVRDYPSLLCMPQSPSFKSSSHTGQIAWKGNCQQFGPPPGRPDCVVKSPYRQKRKGWGKAQTSPQHVTICTAQKWEKIANVTVSPPQAQQVLEFSHTFKGRNEGLAAFSFLKSRHFHVASPPNYF